MKLTEILDLEACRQIVERTNSDEIAILCPHYSINIASKYDDGEELAWDLDEFGELLGHTLFVNDYDDLVCDPHNIMGE